LAKETCKKVTISLVPSGFFWVLVVFLLGFFEYGRTVAGGFATVLVAVAFSMLSLFGFIPILGLFIYLGLANSWLMPKALAFTSISASWVTALILVCGFIFAVIFTVIALILVTVLLR
jgi:hypothetical protein